MPNWCFNDLTLTGSDADLLQFYEDNQGLNTDKKPIPNTLSLNRALPNSSGTIVDNVAQWGTKWDINWEYGCSFTSSPGEINYQFDTAWDPPLLWLKYVAQKYPTIKFKLCYEEPNLQLKGRKSYNYRRKIQ
jgi:hypothetical protein